MGRRLGGIRAALGLAVTLAAVGCRSADTPESGSLNQDSGRLASDPGVKGHPGPKLQMNPNAKMPTAGSRLGGG